MPFSRRGLGSISNTVDIDIGSSTDVYVDTIDLSLSTNKRILTTALNRIGDVAISDALSLPDWWYQWTDVPRPSSGITAPTSVDTIPIRTNAGVWKYIHWDVITGLSTGTVGWDEWSDVGEPGSAFSNPANGDTLIVRDISQNLWRSVRWDDLPDSYVTSFDHTLSGMDLTTTIARRGRSTLTSTILLPDSGWGAWTDVPEPPSGHNNPPSTSKFPFLWGGDWYFVDQPDLIGLIDNPTQTFIDLMDTPDNYGNPGQGDVLTVLVFEKTAEWIDPDHISSRWSLFSYISGILPSDIGAINLFEIELDPGYSSLVSRFSGSTSSSFFYFPLLDPNGIVENEILTNVDIIVEINNSIYNVKSASITNGQSSSLDIFRRLTLRLQSDTPYSIEFPVWADAIWNLNIGEQITFTITRNWRETQAGYFVIINPTIDGISFRSAAGVFSNLNLDFWDNWDDDVPSPTGSISSLTASHRIPVYNGSQWDYIRGDDIGGTSGEPDTYIKRINSSATQLSWTNQDDITTNWAVWRAWNQVPQVVSHDSSPPISARFVFSTATGSWQYIDWSDLEAEFGGGSSSGWNAWNDVDDPPTTLSGTPNSLDQLIIWDSSLSVYRAIAWNQLPTSGGSGWDAWGDVDDPPVALVGIPNASDKLIIWDNGLANYRSIDWDRLPTGGGGNGDVQFNLAFVGGSNRIGTGWVAQTFTWPAYSEAEWVCVQVSSSSTGGTGQYQWIKNFTNTYTPGTSGGTSGSGRSVIAGSGIVLLGITSNRTVLSRTSGAGNSRTYVDMWRAETSVLDTMGRDGVTDLVSFDTTDRELFIRTSVGTSWTISIPGMTGTTGWTAWTHVPSPSGNATSPSGTARIPVLISGSNWDYVLWSNLPSGGGTPTAYIESLEASGNTLNWTDQDNTAFSWTPTVGGGGWTAWAQVPSPGTHNSSPADNVRIPIRVGSNWHYTMWENLPSGGVGGWNDWDDVDRPIGETNINSSVTRIPAYYTSGGGSWGQMQPAAVANSANASYDIITSASQFTDDDYIMTHNTLTAAHGKQIHRSLVMGSGSGWDWPSSRLFEDDIASTHNVVVRNSNDNDFQIAVDEFLEGGFDTLDQQGGLDDDALLATDRIIIRRGNTWVRLNLRDFITSLLFVIPNNLGTAPDFGQSLQWRDELAWR